MGGGGGLGWGGGGGQGGCEEELKFLGGRGGVRGRGRVGGGRVRGVRLDVIEELKFLGKFTKKIWGGGGQGGGLGWVGGGRVSGGGGQGGCEQRIEVFVKIKKNK